MPTLLFRFPARRYHATPWGSHVNEGLIEWPPSPWRLLRALLSCGYTSGLWNGDGPPANARALIEKLAALLPSYHLPPVAGTHSRHYMPLAKFKNGREDTTLVFDTWAQVDEGEVAVTWNAELTVAETELLAQLAERLGYLGRSESWVIARLAASGEAIPEPNCFPEHDCVNPGPHWEQIPLIAAETATAYLHWRDNALGQLRPRQDGYPPTLIDCLQVDTAWLRKFGWSQPPGSRRVFYWRRADALESGAPKPVVRTVQAPPVTAMLLSMAARNGNDHALPSVMRTVAQAELLHRALVSVVEKNGVHSRALTGCDEAGRPLAGPHGHNHVLPLDLDSDGHLDHVLLWAPMGFDHHDQAAVRSVRKTFMKGGVEPLRLALVGSGDLADLTTLSGTFGDGLRTILGSHTGARLWRSVTPFVPPRFLKKRGRNTLNGQLAAELAVRGLPAPDEVRRLDPHQDEPALRHRHFVRSRRRGPVPPVDCGLTLELRFRTVVRGPLCLGYGSHFGLGLFTPVADA